ncbi:MAG TPA: BspA family leucine-rich repeat surface protein [Candidatus Saccharimonadales bacterium]
MHKQYSNSRRHFIRLRGRAGLRLPKRPLYYSAASFSFIGAAVVVLQLLGVINLTTRPVYADAINSTDFVTTWKTDNSDTPNDSSITIPTGGIGYNYDVDWNNDGIFDQFGVTSGITHDFGVPGTYTIRIRGSFPRIYVNQASENRKKLIDIKQWGTGQWQNFDSAFAGAINLGTISATDAPDLSHVTSMENAFAGAPNFNGNIGHWDTSNITDMSGMFANGATSFNGNIGAWNTGNVTDMSYMFANATSFNQPIGNWNTSNVTDMSVMFSNASSFNQDIDGWDTSKVTNMSWIFKDATSFDQPLNSWNVSQVTQTRSAFENATSFNQPIGSWNTSNVTDIASMFYKAAAFNQNINNWDTSKVTDMSNVFSGATSFNQPLSNWDTSNVTNMIAMFNDASTFDQDISNWDTGAVQYMQYMFAGAASFNQPLGGWNTAAVTGMSGMFNGATSFNQSLDSWNVAQVTEMYEMFRAASHFNSSITSWNTSSVTSMDHLFWGASSFNQPIGSWDVSNVTSMDRLFFDASAFNQDISGWDTSNVVDMQLMFQDAAAFNQPLGSWNVSHVTNMRQMFYNASSFNQPIGSWDVSGVEDMSSMFTDTRAFNQPLDNWDTSNVTNMYLIFSNARAFNQSLDAWNMSSVNQVDYMLSFSGISPSNYRHTLAGWSSQSLQPNLSFNAYGVSYCTDAIPARQAIIDSFSWTIQGDKLDCDADGFEDNIEDQAPNNGDGNGDGIKDNLQASVASIPNNALGGGEYVTLQLGSAGNNCASVQWLSQETPADYTGVADDGYEYPVGVTDFGVRCATPGGSAKVTVYYDKHYDTSEWVVRKFSWETNEYRTISGITFDTFDRAGTPVTTMTYTLEDGGPLDDDGQVDGGIVDPIGPAISLTSTGGGTTPPTQTPGGIPNGNGEGKSINAPDTGFGREMRFVLLPVVSSFIVAIFILASGYFVFRRHKHVRR